MKKYIYLLAATASLAAFCQPALAQDDLGGTFSKDRFQIRARAIGVIPDDDSSVNIGGDVDVGDAVVPEVDITYFFTKHIAAELIAATAQHELDYTGGANLGNTWILPPTLTLQYHFTPDSSFSPYLGAGLNYSIFYGEESGTGFTDLNVDNSVGYALQAGFDYWINDNWGLNLDVKKIFLDVDASLNNGAVEADVDIDPWILGAGVSYRF